MSDTLTIRLNGLDCPNCAAKVERGLKKIKWVENATVDLMGQSATISIDAGVSTSNALAEIAKKVGQLEPDIRVALVQDDGTEIPAAQHAAAQSHEHEQGCPCSHDHNEHTHKHPHEHTHKHEHAHAAPPAQGDAEPAEPPTLFGIPRKKAIQYGVGIAFILAALSAPAGAVKITLLLCAYIALGYEVLIRLVQNLMQGEIFDENFLMGIATLGAIAIGEYPEAVGVMFFYNIGEFFQDRAVDKSRKSIKALIGIKPDTAVILTESGQQTVHPSKVAPGSTILVKAGERIPLDGVITEGTTQLDTSALTGESVPRKAAVGDEVLSGSINTTGMIQIKTTKSYADSAVVKILNTVEKVSAKKAPTEQFITRFSRYYTPIVVIVAVLLAFAPPLLFGQPLRPWVQRGLVFLVVSCPCALVLSVPLGYFAGIGACSKKGILVKGGNYLEALTRVKSFVFDKTGTLTKGIFTVIQIKPADGFQEADLLSTAANIEAFSNHPIGKSIVAYYNKPTDETAVTNFEDIAGFGIKADYQGKTCYLGKAALMEKQGLSPMSYNGTGSIVHMDIDGKYAGYIIVSDQIKEDAPQAIRALNTRGIKTAMLTGDKKETADSVGKTLGITTVYSELLPEEKLERLEEIITETAAQGKYKTAFVGDGINDAPALARADVSVAMGGLGQDAAIEVSDVVIMNDQPSKIADAVAIAGRTQSIVWQNIIFALGVKGIILILGAFGFANMWLATFADVGVALLCVFNSMRVR